MGDDLIMPRVEDAFRNDPTIPREVTLTDKGNGWVHSWTKFPDGSAIEETFRREDAATPATPGAPITTDAAARRFAEASAGTLLHDGTAWFAFDGAIWRPTPDVARPVRAALRAAGHDDPGSALVATIERCARSEPELAHAGAWDADPWRLGTPGGTVDLATGRLRPADPADRITRSTSVAPAEHSDCPLWRRFLDEAMDGDAERTAFLQRFCGYALTGETCEHALLFGLGEGGNGKSVFVNIVRDLFGSYAAVAAPDLLAQGAARRGGKAHSAEVAMLAGARLVTASETEEGRVWADGRLKLLTGGDPVTARFPGKDPFTFTPRFKLLVTGNHRPVLRTVDAALRRRLCLVPFPHAPAVPDRRLEAKLRAEAPAILRWMIEGCLAWARSLDEPGESGGLIRPEAVARATDAYLAGEDLVGEFLAQWCDLTPTSLESAGDLFAAWCAFTRTQGEPPGTQRRLAARLLRHGLTREHLHHARVYRGVRLLREGERFAAVREARMG